MEHLDAGVPHLPPDFRACDLRCADVGAVLHDLGDRALASVRFGVVDDMAVDVEFVRAIVDLARAANGAGTPALPGVR